MANNAESVAKNSDDKNIVKEKMDTKKNRNKIIKIKKKKIKKLN